MKPLQPRVKVILIIACVLATMGLFSLVLDLDDTLSRAEADKPGDTEKDGTKDRDYWPTEGWRVATPEEQGMDSAKLDEMMSFVDQNNIAIDSVIVVRHGYIVFEAYRNGYNQQTRHHLQSVTKSFSSMLIGIAIHQGLIESVDHKVIDLFPDHTIANLDARKQSLTLEHLLTMSDGMDWHELDYPYDDARNTLGQMWVSRDAVQHVLDRPMIRDPGESWAYNSGTSILLGGILEQVTGGDVLSFARENLFGPLGIENIVWSKTTGDHYHTDGGLYMTPRDMARFGYLMLNGGTWDGQEIVSAEWVARSSEAHYQIPGGYGYGYQWWILPAAVGYSATGHYEQKIYVLPEADLVVVFTAYIADSDPHPTDGFLYRYILRACTDLPATDMVVRYAKYGFTFEHPVWFLSAELPIPGRDTVSDVSGMVQFNSGSYPLEIINLIWDASEAGVDLEAYLEGFLASVPRQPGVEYTGGESFSAWKGDHEVALEFFQATEQGYAFSGVIGVWYCDQAGRVYIFSYATSSEAASQDLPSMFQPYLDALVCHETD